MMWLSAAQLACRLGIFILLIVDLAALSNGDVGGRRLGAVLLPVLLVKPLFSPTVKVIMLWCACLLVKSARFMLNATQPSVKSVTPST
jgi:hypothetical protein